MTMDVSQMRCEPALDVVNVIHFLDLDQGGVGLFNSILQSLKKESLSVIVITWQISHIYCTRPWAFCTLWTRCDRYTNVNCPVITDILYVALILKWRLWRRINI